MLGILKMKNKCSKNNKSRKCKGISKTKCMYKNIKNQFSKGRIITFIILLFFILAVIILPTGLDDVFTTIPLFFLLGWKLYTVILIVTLVLVFIFFNKIKQIKKKIVKGC